MVKKFIPKKTLQPAVGLDIGARACKWVQLQKTGNNVELLGWGIEAFDGEDAKAALGRVVERLPKACKSPCTAVAGKGTLIRFISLPRMSLSDLRNSFAIEADQYFPFPQDQIYTDCFILDPDSKAKQMSVMAAAVRKELIDQRIQLLTDLGLDIHFVGINALAVANVLHTLGFPRDEDQDSAVALLDIGDALCSLTILINKLPWFVRDIYIGVQDFEKRIAGAAGLSPEEAKKTLREPLEGKENLREVVEAVWADIIQELRLSFDYFTTEKGYEISKLLITGEGSVLAKSMPGFEKGLGVNAEAWNPLHGITIAPDAAGEEAARHAPALAAAIGLSLYHYA